MCVSERSRHTRCLLPKPRATATDLPVAQVLRLGRGEQGLVGISPSQHELGGGVCPVLALSLVKLDELVGDCRHEGAPRRRGHVTVEGDGGHVQAWQHCLHSTRQR